MVNAHILRAVMVVGLAKTVKLIVNKNHMFIIKPR
jgi:uncharacterized ion transporter superfamily protein YfcC